MTDAITLQPVTAEPLRIEPTAGLPVILAPVASEAIGIALVNGVPGPKGASGDAYDHMQASPAFVWTIAHNLGRRPSVTTLSVGGLVMEGTVLHLSPDTLTVTFLQSVAGSAHLV